MGQFNRTQKYRTSFRAKTRARSAREHKSAAACQSANFQFDISGKFSIQNSGQKYMSIELTPRGLHGSFGRILFLLRPPSARPSSEIDENSLARSLQTENRDSLSERSSTLRSASLPTSKCLTQKRRGDTDPLTDAASCDRASVLAFCSDGKC